MISSENGNVRIKGDFATIMADLACMAETYMKFEHDKKDAPYEFSKGALIMAINQAYRFVTKGAEITEVLNEAENIFRESEGKNGR